MGWRFEWEVIVWWESDTLSPYGVVRKRWVVDRVWKVRKIVEAFRADRWARKYTFVRKLKLEEPCTAGHDFYWGNAQAIQAITHWYECNCGGHRLYICTHPGCGDRQVVSPALVGCEPTPIEQDAPLL